MRLIKFLAENLRPPQYLSEKEFRFSILIYLHSFAGAGIGAILVFQGINIGRYIAGICIPIGVITIFWAKATNAARCVQNKWQYVEKPNKKSRQPWE